MYCQFFLNERKPRNFGGVDSNGGAVLNAHNKKLSTKTTVAKQDIRDNKLAESGSQKDIMRCFACFGRGHRAVDYFSRAKKF